MDSLAKKINEDGFSLIDDLFTPEECDEMLREMSLLTANYSCNSRRFFFKASNDGGPQFKEKYFIESAHNISFFYEEKAVSTEGNLLVETEHLALNKVGHALHTLNPVFKKYTIHNKIKDICSKLGMVEPRVCQSMFIFKNPRIGGEVPPHQDASYLYTEPQSLYGIWIALEDCHIENGCLWFEKGSHRNEIGRRYIRNPERDSDQLMITIGEDLEYKLKNFVPVPVKKGSCIVIHGKVSHFSKANVSNESRNVYTFHVFDDSKSKYSIENWLQPSGDKPFIPVYQ